MIYPAVSKACRRSLGNLFLAPRMMMFTTSGGAWKSTRVAFRTIKNNSPTTTRGEGRGRRSFSTALPHQTEPSAFASLHKGGVGSSGVVEEADKAIAYWLLGMSGLVAAMVTIGGVTRLTRSGLSMTDWSITGRMPPTTQERWEEEFEIYKQFPEYQQRKSMTLDEFKFIFWWEYGHRMMGRFLGVAFTGPLVYFAARGKIPRWLAPRLGGLFALGGMQGLIGWWMVKSGLDVDTSSARGDMTQEIRVSPYRLATHLSMAFTTYTALLWTAMDILNPARVAQTRAAQINNPQILKHAAFLRRFALGNTALIATTVLSGAYVAGNDAGRAYNSFPKMGDEWIPSEILALSPVWKNFTENTATVQFDHRVLAMSSLASIATMYGQARYNLNGTFWKAAPPYVRLIFNKIAVMSAAQVGLGISTLLLYVPVPLAAVHQAGSLVLLTFSLATAHSLKFAKYAPHLTKVAGKVVS